MTAVWSLEHTTGVEPTWIWSLGVSSWLDTGLGSKEGSGRGQLASQQ